MIGQITLKPCVPFVWFALFCVLPSIYYIDASTGTTTFYLSNAYSVSIFPIMYGHI